MARTFSSTTHKIASTDVTTAPQAQGTVVFHFKPAWSSGDSARHYLFRVFLNTTAGTEFGAVKADDNTLYYGWIKTTPTTDFDEITVADTGLFTSGTWAHWAFTWSDSANTLEVLKNAASVVSGTAGLVTYAAGTGYEHAIGMNPGHAHDIRGDVAEYAMWNVVLSATELEALSDGISPMLIRPEALIVYVPLHGRYSPEVQPIATPTWTVTGATQSAHPKVFYPNGSGVPDFGVTAAPASGNSLICWF